MTDVFMECWRFFSKQTGIWERFSYISTYKLEILCVVFALALFLGFYIFRLYLCATFFYLYVTACALFLPRFFSWSKVVAFFSVSGVMFSFLMYKCNRIGSIVLCGIIAAMMGYMILPESFCVAGFALLGMAITFFFPVHGICIFMALFGGLGFSSLLGFPDVIGLTMAFIGAAFQIWLARNQTVFDNMYPAKIQYLIDKKRAKA